MPSETEPDEDDSGPTTSPLSLLHHRRLRTHARVRKRRVRALGSGKGATRVGSVMAARCAILVLLAAKGSLFEMHPCMQLVFGMGSTLRWEPTVLPQRREHGCTQDCPNKEHVKIGTVWVFPKMVEVYQTSLQPHVNQSLGPPAGHGEILDKLEDFRPLRLPRNKNVDLVEHYIGSKGVSRIKGSAKLKASQSYPNQFLLDGFSMI